MSPIIDLIAQLCPGGVKFQKLAELGSRNKGTAITAAQMKAIRREGGPIRVFAGGQTIADVAEGAVPEKDVVRIPSIVVKSRGHIGFTYYERPFTHKAELWSYSISREDVDQRFVYYYLLTQVESLQEIARANSVKLPQLGVKDTDTLLIPLPPLEVQCEIVKVLDTLTELERELRAELKGELDARRQQYCYYRDALLSLDERSETNASVKLMALNDFCSIYDGTHQTPKYTKSGVKFVSVENINALDLSEKFISEEDFDKAYKVKPRTNDLFMTRIGSIGVCSVVENDEPLAYYVTLALIRPSPAIVNSKFLKFIIESNVGSSELRKRTLVNATPIKINLGEIGKIKIPVPPLEEQERIVSILEKFDALMNDLSAGLSAELHARRQQYVHYRDRLLTFKEAA